MAAPPAQALVLSFEDARSIVEEHASRITPGGNEVVDLLHASGRILAEPITADRDIPPFPRSTRDGYAVRSADLTKVPARLAVAGEIKAGLRPSQVPLLLNSGQAFSIMTGAPVPQGADAVVMVEYTSLFAQNDSVEITKAVEPGENIVAQAAEAKSGSLLLDRGEQLDHATIALAASVGKSRLQVFARPRVAVLTTGDEIVDVDGRPGPTQIRNSNTYSLAAQIQEAGGEAVLLPIAPDEPHRLRQLIEQGLESDLLIMTGGVSMGRYDLVEQVLAEMNAEFLFTGAKIQPGRPVVFGRVPYVHKTPFSTPASTPSPHNYFFGLPGNPVSTMVTFELFARPILEALAGKPAHPLAFVHARLKSEIRVKTGLRRFLPAVLSGQYENSQVELVPWQGSGDIAARSRANCYVVIPPDREQISAGDWVAIMLR
ncbi:MAG TPA: gephyrin-like molybdotransferase Glp [Candidatus Dormibacteraeota bacterium]|jgi:molybdopterin molybdotransferase|nr:gephyrin-like molybdotransferase Glp [Candidatus Dormibacteraeota bacterium]